MPLLRSLLLLMALAPVASADTLPVRGTTRAGESYVGTVRLDAASSGQYAVSCSWSSAKDRQRLTGTLRARRQGGAVILEGSIQRSARPRGWFRRTTRTSVWIKIVRSSAQRLAGAVWEDGREALRFRGERATRSAPRSSSVKASVVPRGLNLRRSSTSGSGVITTLPRGTQVDVLDTSREPWWLVRGAGQQGYVHSAYLKTESAARPTSSTRSTRTGPPHRSHGTRRSTRSSGARPRSGSRRRVRRSGPPSRRRASSSSGTRTPSPSRDGAARPDPGRAWDGSPIRFIPANARNYTRSSGRRITKIVIHTIEGSESSGINWFKDPKAHVSAHYVVSHSGRVTQMVKDQDVAHHVRGHNNNSIGIENEGHWKWDTWTQTQMKTLARLVAHLCDRYGIPADRRHILSHGQLDPKRRSDPGPHFKWDWFIKEVKRLQKN